MNQRIFFFAPGVPQPKGSKRHVGRGVMIESCKDLPAWMESLRMAARSAYQGPPVDEPCVTIMKFEMPKPKRPKYDFPATAPDIDKLARAVHDAITGIIITNDSRVWRSISSKAWASGKWGPGAYVQVIVGR